MYLAFLVAVVLLFLPGCAVIRAIDVCSQIPLAIVMAPAVSAAYYGILGVLYSRIGVTASPISMLAPAIVILVVDVFLSHKNNEKVLPISRQALGFVALYAAVGTCIGWYVFVRSLPGFDSMVEQYDVVFHANLIRHFIDTGNFSCLGIDVSVLGAGFYGGNSSGFYPAAWHELVALVTMTRGVSLTESMNAVNWAICGVAFPVGMLGLFMFIFKKDRQSILLGSVVPVAFTTFPWRDLLWGPIFSNTAAFCCAPAVAVALIIAITPSEYAKHISKLIACGVLGVIGLGVLQPNAVFAIGVFAASYVVHVLITSDSKPLHTEKEKGLRKVRCNRIVSVIVFLLICMLIWALLYVSPLMRNVVNYSWPSYSTLTQAFINVLTQSYMMGNGYVTYPQLLLATVILLGLVAVFFRRDLRWLILPNAFFVASFIMNVSSDGFIKHFLTGFWYTDPNRIAAICAITVMPFAAIGLSLLTTWMRMLVIKYSDFSKTACRLLPGFAVTLIFLLANFYPSYVNPTDGRSVTTAFAAIRGSFSAAYAKSAAYSQAEEDFVKKAMEIVPDGDLVINYPGDGSVAAYGFDGLNVVYNQIENGNAAAQSCDSVESQLIRTSLYQIATNNDVRKVVDEIGARYVILLSNDDGGTSINGTFVPDDWGGVSRIDDDTPGFQVIMSQGNMRLYEIEG
ncbi:MAG: DUF6541 family protein [Atopobiaceae bacterium]